MLRSTQWSLLAAVAPLSFGGILEWILMTLLQAQGGLMPMPLAKDPPFFHRCVRVSLCNQKSLNIYFNRIFLLTQMMKTLILINLLHHHQTVKILELLGSSRQQLELDQQATERPIWPEMFFHFLRLMVIRSSVNSACKLSIFLVFLIN